MGDHGRPIFDWESHRILLEFLLDHMNPGSKTHSVYPSKTRRCVPAMRATRKALVMFCSKNKKKPQEDEESQNDGNWIWGSLPKYHKVTQLTQHNSVFLSLSQNDSTTQVHENYYTSARLHIYLLVRKRKNMYSISSMCIHNVRTVSIYYVISLSLFRSHESRLELSVRMPSAELLRGQEFMPSDQYHTYNSTYCVYIYTHTVFIYI